MFNRSEIMKAAWAQFRTLPKNSQRSPRDRFAWCLSLAWDAAKKAVTAPAVVKLAPAPVLSRTAAIKAELDAMNYSNFIDWNRHGALSAELARLGA